jgi:hypothetical protein
MCRGGDSRPTMTQNHPSMMNNENLGTRKVSRAGKERREKSFLTVKISFFKMK